MPGQKQASEANQRVAEAHQLAAEANRCRICGQAPAQACSGRRRQAAKGSQAHHRCGRLAMRHSRSARLLLARRRGGAPFLLAPHPSSLVWLLLVLLLCGRRRLIGAAWQRLADLNQLPHPARIQMFRDTTRVQRCECRSVQQTARRRGGGSSGRRRHGPAPEASTLLALSRHQVVSARCRAPAAHRSAACRPGKRSSARSPASHTRLLPAALQHGAMRLRSAQLADWQRPARNPAVLICAAAA